MKPLKERNQASVGAVTLVVLALVTATVYFSDSIPLFGNGTTYSAYFAESAGLAADNEVEVAGVKVGQVTSVKLAGKQVLVTFRVKDVHVGDQTSASIEIKTLLGEKYLALDPHGTGTQSPDSTIPQVRTRTPFELQDAFNQLSTTVGDINTQQLADSFNALSDSLKDSPQYLKDTLSGLSSLAQTVSSRDKDLHTLLAGTSDVSKTLSDRNTQLQRVIGDGNLLLSELQDRKAAIDQLLTGTQRLSQQLTGLVADNRKQLGPTLDKLGKVTDILQRNQDNLDKSLQLMAPFARVGANATGNGRWFEGYLCGLLPPTITAAGFTVNPEGCTPPIAAPNQGVGGR